MIRRALRGSAGTASVAAVVFGVLVCARAAGATDVSGNITTNTVWTLAGSPYVVVSNVLVKSGVTLTIEPGVTVRFVGPDYSLMTDSTQPSSIVAEGLPGSTILFTSNDPSPYPGIWGSVGIFSSPGSSFRRCVFQFPKQALHVEFCNPPIEDCVFDLCEEALYFRGSVSAVSGCAIVNSTRNGIRCVGPTASPVIDDCNFDNPVVTVYNVFLQQYYGAHVDIDARYNWWGTDSEPGIQEKILDGTDEPSVHATVLYDSWYHSPGVESRTWGSIKAMFRD